MFTLIYFLGFDSKPRISQVQNFIKKNFFMKQRIKFLFLWDDSLF